MRHYWVLVSFLSLLMVTTPVVKSSSEGLEGEFHPVADFNRGVEKLFPEKFNADQMACFYKKKAINYAQNTIHPMTEEAQENKIGQMIPGESFYQNVMPYSLQMLTGTCHKYAEKIRFARVVNVKDGELEGLYEYVSSYESLYSALGYASTVTFPVCLTLDPSYKVYNLDRVVGACRIFNLKESVLGAHDFISSVNQLQDANKMLPNACIFNIFRQDEAFINQTNEVHRLEFNIKSLLAILDQLKGNDLYHMTPEQQIIRQTEMYQQLREDKKCAAGEMTKETYKACLLHVRAEIFAQMGIDPTFIPEVSGQDIVLLHEGKILFVVPDVSAGQNAN